MSFYEIKNTKTQETFETTARNFAAACYQKGWKPQECRCVWKASTEAAY